VIGDDEVERRGGIISGHYQCGRPVLLSPRLASPCTALLTKCDGV
jgi:hypothetical protein